MCALAVIVKLKEMKERVGRRTKYLRTVYSMSSIQNFSSRKLILMRLHQSEAVHLTNIMHYDSLAPYYSDELRPDCSVLGQMARPTGVTYVYYYFSTFENYY